MQNKGLINTFAILFGLVSLYSISFSFSTKKAEDKAFEYANTIATDGDGKEVAKIERQYLDSVANDTNLYFNLYTYNDIKEKSINLGLDLKGGINAILQVSVKDILKGLSNDSKNPIFNQALADASKAQSESNRPYLNLFFDSFEKIKGDTNLSDADIFGNRSLYEKINSGKSNDEVEAVLAEEVSNSISTAFRVLRTRIDKFGVTQPNIQRIGKSGRILIELPGAKDIHRVQKLLQSTAELQFWEAYSNQEVAQYLIDANTKVQELLKADSGETADSTEVAEKTISELLGGEEDPTSQEAQNNLFSVLSPNIPRSQDRTSAMVGFASLKDTAKVNKYLAMKEVRNLIPANLKYVKFLWDAKPRKDSEIITLYAIKSNRNNKPPIEGDVIDDAIQTFDQLGINPEISMTMNSHGSKLWAKMTTANVGKFVAVVLDDYVYTAPVVNDAITSGRTSISGSYDINEAKDLANVLKAGKLPAKAHIVQSEIVGPSLGKEAIEKSIYSFVLALVLVFVWMIFYYGKAGIFADIALVINILFIFGVLTAFGFVLTLPGIAGIILTIGMSVDANVIIFERIKEELAKGKKLKQAIVDGFSFKGALSAIIDANITTMLTGIILFMFGTGPVQGFALTLIIGILTSLFTAVFITRMLVDWYANRGGDFTFSTVITKGWFQSMNIEFLKKRKMAYIISGVVILLGIGSLLTNGLNQGVDFKGGRSYVVKFDQAPNSEEVANSLKELFKSTPEVKTYGSDKQLKITTKFRIEEEGQTIDDEIQELLFSGLQSYLPDGATLEEFQGGFDNQKIGIMSSIKVEPTIADDIKTAAGWAVFGSLLVVFLYILLRFKKWQYSFGAVVAVFHDVLIVLAIFSIFYKWMPFDMEIGQSFIAAILTVVGYSLNDTVVIFDRIREFTGLHKTWKFSEIVDKGLSSTLGRTINTSMTTLVVMLAIFLFGGDSIKGFMFALIVGVVVGTYSSLFVASPIMYDTMVKGENKKK